MGTTRFQRRRPWLRPSWRNPDPFAKDYSGGGDGVALNPVPKNTQSTRPSAAFLMQTKSKYLCFQRIHMECIFRPPLLARVLIFLGFSGAAPAT